MRWCRPGKSAGPAEPQTCSWPSAPFILPPFFQTEPPPPSLFSALLSAVTTGKEEQERRKPFLLLPHVSCDSNGAILQDNNKTKQPCFLPALALALPSHSHDSSPPAMPSPLRNGDAASRLPSPAVGRQTYHFHSTVSEQKVRRVNTLILLLRLAAFCFSFAAAIFMATNSSRSAGSPSWLHFHPFRFVFAANGIVAAYSLLAMGFSIWEILKGATLLPEAFQLWFDFAHDQVFAYLVAAAEAAGTVEAQGLKGAQTCSGETSFCVQAYISVALGFAGFVFLALSALVSGFRIASHVITGSRFHLY